MRIFKKKKKRKKKNQRNRFQIPPNPKPFSTHRWNSPETLRRRSPLPSSANEKLGNCISATVLWSDALNFLRTDSFRPQLRWLSIQEAETMSLPPLECVYVTEEAVKELKNPDSNFKFPAPAPILRFLYELCYATVIFCCLLMSVCISSSLVVSGVQGMGD